MTRAHIVPKSGTITKPLLAARFEGQNLSDLTYPIGVTNKIDGIRCLMIDGHAVSRTFKPIPNKHIREILEKWMPTGMDMEIMSGSNFQECTGNIMREDGEPAFHIYIIDYVHDRLDRPYQERMAQALDIAQGWQKAPFDWTVLEPDIAKSEQDVNTLEALALEAGHEGIMLRRLDAPYKCGRSTVRDGILIKVKRFYDQEAVVMNVEELFHNENAKQKDAFGRTKRSTAQDNLVGGGTLGSLIVKGKGGDYNGVEFRVGSGFTQAQRQSLWKDRKSLIGRLATIKYFPTGTKEAPRFPVFKGWRHPDDIS